MLSERGGDEREVGGPPFDMLDDRAGGKHLAGLGGGAKAGAQIYLRTVAIAGAVFDVSEMECTANPDRAR